MLRTDREKDSGFSWAGGKVDIERDSRKPVGKAGVKVTGPEQDIKRQEGT